MRKKNNPTKMSDSNFDLGPILLDETHLVCASDHFPNTTVDTILYCRGKGHGMDVASTPSILVDRKKEREGGSMEGRKKEGDRERRKMEGVHAGLWPVDDDDDGRGGENAHTQRSPEALSFPTEMMISKASLCCEMKKITNCQSSSDL